MKSKYCRRCGIEISYYSECINCTPISYRETRYELSSMEILAIRYRKTRRIKDFINKPTLDKNKNGKKRPLLNERSKYFSCKRKMRNPLPGTPL